MIAGVWVLLALPAHLLAYSPGPPIRLAQLSGSSLLMELRHWRMARESNDALGYQAYLQQYPDGKFARLAKSRLAALSRANPPADQSALPPPADEAAPAAADTQPQPTIADSPAAPVSAQSEQADEALLPLSPPAPVVVEAEPEPEPEPVAVADPRLEQWLNSAQEDITALRLTSPAGNNAMAKINRVFEVEPGNTRALELRSQVVGRYIKLAKTQQRRNNLAKARRFLNRAQQVDPESEALHDAMRELEQAEEMAAETRSQTSPQPLPTLGRENKTEMAVVRGGCYLMGSPEQEFGRDLDERQHQVCVADFQIAVTDVTRAQFARFVGATGYVTDAERNAGGKPGCSIHVEKWKNIADTSWRNPGYEQTNEHPAVCVSWNDAMAYVEWLSAESGRPYRLPTEAEWEFAARAGTTTPFPTGKCIHTDQANYNGGFDYAGCGAKTGVYRKGTVAVRFANPNSFGLYNMSGNVWNWTCSAYDKAYAGAELSCADRSQAAPRTVRGGSWFFKPEGLRSASRSWDRVEYRDSHQGFRLAGDA